MDQVDGVSPKGTLASVTSLKQSLSKELTKLEKESVALSSAFFERCLDILNELERLPIDLSVLCKTLIGTVVTKFKKCSDENVSSKAKLLVRKWKDVASKSGVSKSQASKLPAPIQAPKPASVQKLVVKPPRNIPAPPEWISLPTLRKNICQKLYEVFVTSPGAKYPKSKVISTCTDIECALTAFSRNDIINYKDKARSISFNLKRNVALRGNLVDGSIVASDLMNMTPEQLATDEKKAEREKLEKDVNDARRLDWDQANEDKINDVCGIKGDLLNASLFTCSRCKSIKTTSTQKQTRSADEPMTVFVLCLNCNKRWRC